MPYKVRVKIPIPQTDGGESRKQTKTERKAWLAKVVTSKYDPHQSKRETNRRIKKEMF